MWRQAFGVGIVLATQNPMDVDYRALSNAGLWFVGRLQTDAHRERVVEAMAGAGRKHADGAQELAPTLRQIGPRWFVMLNVHRAPAMGLVLSRCTMCWLRGPMTRSDMKRLVRAEATRVRP